MRSYASILIQDVGHAIRQLGRSAGFTITAVLTLALGIGASTAIFTILNTTLLKPLSYHESGRLVALWERVRFLQSEAVGPNPRHFGMWRERTRSYEGMTLVRQSAVGFSQGLGHPQLVGVVIALPNLFEVLEVQPLLGRAFGSENGVAGRDQVAILTYSFWKTALNGDPDVVGKSIRLGDLPREVIGVLPEGFHFPNRNALRAMESKQAWSDVPEPVIFVPAAMNLQDFGWNSDYGNWTGLARLKPGVAVERAQAELNSIQSQIESEMPANVREDQPNSLRATVQPMQEAIVGNSRTGLWVLMAAVLGLMLIACVNLANAQLARTLARQREASVRAALGAPRWRLVFGLMAENVLLAVAGGVGGVLLAQEALDLFRRYSPVDLPRASEIQLDPQVLVFSLVLMLGSTVLFSILPALSLMRTDPQGFLQRGGSRALGGEMSGKLRGWLIGLQVFGCTALLLVTGLLSKNLLQLVSQEKGFDSSQVAFAQVTLPAQTYGPAASRVVFIDSALRELRAIPGVQAAGLISAMPLEGETWIEGMTRADLQLKETPLINLRWASPGYFEAMRHRLVAGRFLEERDKELSSVMLSEGEARALWKGQDPIGGEVEVQGKKFRVVGVVADSKSTSLKTAPAKIAWLHYQYRTPANLFFMVRGGRQDGGLVAAVRSAIWRFAPQVTIARSRMLDDQVNASLGSERFQTFVLTAFGAAAMLLAMLGIYGTLSYSVAVRKREIGVRVALGASRGRIYGQTLRECGTPVVAGLIAGLVASVAAGRGIGRVLAGAQTVDFGVMAAVCGILIGAAVVAGFVPARRAASVDPMTTLRAE